MLAAMIRRSQKTKLDFPVCAEILALYCRLAVYFALDIMILALAKLSRQLLPGGP